MSEKVQVDFLIIGGGIIGLMCAYELSCKFKNSTVAILEKEIYLGEHSSGRNSGVLHAGIYYPQNGLKRKFCIEGNKVWRELASELNVKVINCGKYVFSSSPEEEFRLNEIYNQAKRNGVSGIRWCKNNEVDRVRDFCHATQAFYSETSAIIDAPGLMKKLTSKLESRGVIFQLGVEAKSIDRVGQGFQVETSQYQIDASVVINTAGLYAVDFRRKLGLDGYENLYVKGNYLSTHQKLGYPFLFYPVPPSDLRGLGVHSTIDVQGKVKFGPNTEGVDRISYAESDLDLTKMKAEVIRLFRGVEGDKLYWDYAGIRSKIVDEKSGEVLRDFIINKDGPYIECLGIESPGLTSAPAIGKYVASLV